MKFTAACSAALLLGAAAATPAQVIFSDDFDANPFALNGTPSGWTVANGTVDVVGSQSFFDPLSGNGAYVDLDGSTGAAGVLSRSFSLLAGKSYRVSFTLAGSTRNDSNTVDVSLGSAAGSFVLASGASANLFSLDFTPGADGSFTLSFANQGGDSMGALLLGVSVESVTAAIPEPQTYALMLAGLAGLGLMTRRRRSVAVQPAIFSRQ